MKKMVLMFLMAVCFLASTGTVWAGDSVGVLEKLLVNGSDIAIFRAGTHNNKPACGTLVEEWALSLTTEAGKAMYSLLLSAAAQGQVVQVVGENACNAQSDRESPRRIWVDY